jgi:O-acetyl-ADP-ribose deacetylase (regulator of RNase III)
MLTYHRSSLLTSKAQTLVNTVNTFGVMGKGLAADFKYRYPSMFEQYKKICAEGLLDIGKLWLWKGGDQWVLNFPTKRHWRYPSKMEYIQEGLEKFVKEYDQRGITEIAFPRLGCGNGGLDWPGVREVMHSMLSPLPIKVYIHDHSVDLPAPEHIRNTDGSLGGTFSSFLCDIRVAIRQNQGKFHTLTNQKPFSASFDDSGECIHLKTEKSRFSIDDLDLYDLWLLLQKGPVEVRRMVGGAKEAGYYLLPILTSLNYLRLARVSPDEGLGALAIEIAERPAGVLEAA